MTCFKNMVSVVGLAGTGLEHVTCFGNIAGVAAAATHEKEMTIEWLPDGGQDGSRAN